MLNREKIMENPFKKAVKGENEETSRLPNDYRERLRGGMKKREDEK